MTFFGPSDKTRPLLSSPEEAAAPLTEGAHAPKSEPALHRTLANALAAMSAQGTIRPRASVAPWEPSRSSKLAPSHCDGHRLEGSHDEDHCFSVDRIHICRRPHFGTGTCAE